MTASGKGGSVRVTSDHFDLETCRSWFATRGLAPFLTPEYLKVVEELPLLASGKFDGPNFSPVGSLLSDRGTMRAAIYRGKGNLEVAEIAVPGVGPSEVE
ncbi:MAG: hypothetical protein CM1200mP26_19430 [Acidimicrobiales bacterium]|nr:MAG: hypothetical protein CM1200mP26_19430 [Acidimicrobiales bacterium]